MVQPQPIYTPLTPLPVSVLSLIRNLNRGFLDSLLMDIRLPVDLGVMLRDLPGTARGYVQGALEQPDIRSLLSDSVALAMMPVTLPGGCLVTPQGELALDDLDGEESYEYLLDLQSRWAALAIQLCRNYRLASPVLGMSESVCEAVSRNATPFLTHFTESKKLHLGLRVTSERFWQRAASDDTYGLHHHFAAAMLPSFGAHPPSTGKLQPGFPSQEISAKRKVALAEWAFEYDMRAAVVAPALSMPARQARSIYMELHHGKPSPSGLQPSSLYYFTHSIPRIHIGVLRAGSVDATDAQTSMEAFLHAFQFYTEFFGGNDRASRRAIKADRAWHAWRFLTREFLSMDCRSCGTPYLTLKEESVRRFTCPACDGDLDKSLHLRAKAFTRLKAKRATTNQAALEESQDEV